MTNPWVCIECGAQQAEAGACKACGSSETLDAREERVRELMYDVDLRLAQKAESRARLIGVGLGIVVVVGLWLIPDYWYWRGRLYPGLPFLADQWAFMIVIGIVTTKILERKLKKKRFPYLDEAQRITE